MRNWLWKQEASVRLLLAVVPFLILSGGLGAAEADIPFKVGEKLTYQFYWGAFMVGRGTFEVKEGPGKNTLLLSVRTVSNKFISNLYPVDNLIESVFDPEEIRSLSFFQDRNEGKHHTWEETFFYYPSKIASTTSYISGDTKWFEIPSKPVQDKVSFIYSMRCLDWSQRKEAEAIIGNDKENRTIKISRLGEEILEEDHFKAIPTFKVQPSTGYMKGFVKSGTMSVWVSQDQFKVPIVVEAKLSFGTVKAVLVEVTGLEGWPYNQ